MVSVSTVLFDLGDVVCHFRPERRLAALAAASGLPEHEVSSRLWASGFSEACDRGCYSAAEMYERACALLAWQPGYAAFCATWVLAFEPNHEVLALVDVVRRRVRTGLLTNSPSLLLEALPDLLPQVRSRFDPVLFSCEFGTLKPDATLFTAVLSRLDQPAHTVLLIDDALQNIEGARAVGLQACLFTSVLALRSDLKAYGIIV
jgi:putative hydrolase of the HAD superfamily